MKLAKAAVAREPEKPRLDERYCAYKLSIKPSRIHRWGLFAEEAIPVRRKVIEYRGERISRRETKRRADERPLHYIFTLDKYWCLDGAVGGSGAEYINHSCEPNVWTLISNGHILYMAKRAVKAGEELFVDYHFGAEVEIVPCACGAKTCRGTINDKPE